jgi:eukaryotic-like serine/threonine-protein kinase
MHTCFSVSFLAVCMTAVTVPAMAQTMFHADAVHSGVYSTQGPHRLDKPAWTFKTGGAVLSSAAVVDGTAYFGSDDRSLYAVDIATGLKKWSFATGGIVRSSPAVSGGVVYFASYDGEIYALDAKSGAKKWAFETQGERHFEARGLHGFKPSTQTIPDFWDMYESSPVASDGAVYIGSGDGNLYVLDAATGALRWKFATGDVVHSSPAIADGVVYFGSWDTYLYALDAKSGAEKWRFKTGDDKKYHNMTGIQSSPVVVNGIVYFGCRDSNMYALDAATGAKKWSNSCTWINATPAVSDGRVYYGTSIPSFFFGLDTATGAVKFKLAIPLMVFSSPAIANGVAYFGDFDGCLYAVDLKAGSILSVYRTKASLAHKRDLLKPDGTENNAVIFRNDEFEDMYHSAEVFFSAGAILASPTLCDGALFVGSTDGNFYCFR